MKMSFTFSSFFLLIVSRARLTDTVGADWEKLKKGFTMGSAGGNASLMSNEQ